MFYPMIARNIMNDYVPNQNLRLLVVWAIVMAAIYAVKSVLTYIVGYWGHVLGVRIQGDMRRALFRHIETLPFSYFDENKTGGIMSRIVNDLFEVSELAHHGPEDLFNSLISVVGGAGDALSHQSLARPHRPHLYSLYALFRDQGARTA